MKTQDQKSSRFAGLTKSELARLIQQYGCGPVRFSGTDEALYERHLVFDNVMEMSAIGARERYEAIARSVRDVLSQRWIHTEKTYERLNAKRVYDLSMEFLIGRSLANNVTNLLLDPVARAAIKDKNLDWFELLEQEPDAAWGMEVWDVLRLASWIPWQRCRFQLPGTACATNTACSNKPFRTAGNTSFRTTGFGAPTPGKSRVQTKP